MKKLSIMLFAGLLLSLFFVGGAVAIPVQYTGVYGGSIYISGAWHTGNVNAGIYKLLVNGSPMDSFCIDLQDTSNSSVHDYSVVALSAAADPTFGPMGATAASDVSKLWALGYAAGMSQAAALSLQVAIWEVVAEWSPIYGTNIYDLTNGAFVATNSGAATLLAGLATFQGQVPFLYGLTNRTYQDYVTVPEPATLLILGFGLFGIAGISRKLKK
jgi:hypothetical protein